MMQLQPYVQLVLCRPYYCTTVLYPRSYVVESVVVILLKTQRDSTDTNALVGVVLDVGAFSPLLPSSPLFSSTVRCPLFVAHRSPFIVGAGEGTNDGEDRARRP